MLMRDFFMVVEIHVEVFWVVTPGSEVGYQRLRRTLLPPSSGWSIIQVRFLFRVK